MKNKFIVKASAFISVISGTIILFSAIYPIASYEAESKSKYPTLLSPLVDGYSTSYYENDFTKASNWFVGNTNLERNNTTSEVNTYLISIPKLNIENAIVKVGGEDLSESLIHFGGTALPGKVGNSVIFGHSILPQFYDPEDYLSIFSLLPTLSPGDEIFINFDGIEYKYIIENMYEVLPTDVFVLDQKTNDSYISLITCVPPGHPLKPKRLVVRAKVIPPEL